MLIQEGTFIPDSRVCEVYCPMEASLSYTMAPETRNQEGGRGQFIPPPLYHSVKPTCHKSVESGVSFPKKLGLGSDFDSRFVGYLRKVPWEIQQKRKNGTRLNWDQFRTISRPYTQLVKRKERKKEAYSFIQKGFTNPKKSQKNFNFNKKQLDF